jgi:hypothetical protein
MNNGKEKCKALKQIRKQIAENNDIKYVVEECKHKGNCKGTCPKCEAEVRYLERELEKRRMLGQKVAIAGVSVGIAATFSACSPMDVVYAIADPIANIFDGGNDLGGATATPVDYAGDIQYIEPELEGEPVEYIPEDYNTEGHDNDGCEGDDCTDDGTDNFSMEPESGEAPPEDDYELEGGLEYYPEDDFNITIDEIF